MLFSVIVMLQLFSLDPGASLGTLSDVEPALFEE